METKLILALNDTDTASTWPDIVYVCGGPTQQICHKAQRSSLLAQQENPLRYWVSTNTTEIMYEKESTVYTANELVVEGICDSGWGNDPDTGHSATRYRSWRCGPMYTEATDDNGPEHRRSRVFPSVTTEFRLGIDNQAALAMTSNPTFSCRTRKTLN
ncbi:LOW QUALITY PROTEIN: Copia type Polyprotein [Phytophthora megakarya]|uniref:Copia type Polyprotein n=1 Tax=Phytophthora megakarya TaxID=4795 RepID=A0A225WJS2_9STRA|nr:LOW QUALITY PROTEIN: Copia type Polyprotein [Phytophthora megakarya]